jgi:hypothetical protein
MLISRRTLLFKTLIKMDYLEGIVSRLNNSLWQLSGKPYNILLVIVRIAIRAGNYRIHCLEVNWRLK